MVVVDDHDWTRQALGHFIDMHEDLQVVGSVRDGEAAVQLALQLRPDVVVVDASMPGMGGVATTRRLRRYLPDVCVVLLSVGYDGRLVRRALAAGACGFLVKNGVAHVIAQAIRTAAAGGRPMAPEVVPLLDP